MVSGEFRLKKTNIHISLPHLNGEGLLYCGQWQYIGTQLSTLTLIELSTDPEKSRPREMARHVTLLS